MLQLMGMSYVHNVPIGQVGVSPPSNYSWKYGMYIFGVTKNNRNERAKGMRMSINAFLVHHGALGIDVVILVKVTMTNKHTSGKLSMTNSIPKV